MSWHSLSENIAKSFRGGGYFFDSHCIVISSETEFHMNAYTLESVLSRTLETHHFAPQPNSNQCTAFNRCPLKRVFITKQIHNEAGSMFHTRGPPPVTERNEYDDRSR